MPGTIRFSRAINLVGGKKSDPPHEATSLVDLLCAAQRQGVSFLPVSPHLGLGSVGRGLSGYVDQSTADAATTFTFKNGIPSRHRHDDGQVQDWYSLVTQLSILQHPPIRVNQHIIDLVGISWKVDAPGPRAWPYLVTPKVNRGSLANYLLEETITDEVRFQICAELVEAFALLHGCGIGHGDVKPDNVLIEQDGEGNIRCKVVDFGSSVIRGQERVPEGTRPWNAPELQIGQRNHVTAEDILLSDLYSIGLLVSHILIPKADLVNADLFFLRPTNTGMNTLRIFQKDDSLGPKLLSLAGPGTISLPNQQILEMIVRGTLRSDPSLRDLSWSQALTLTQNETRLNNETLKAPILPPAAVSSTPATKCLHKTLDLMADLGEYDDFDYIVRADIAEDIRFKATSNSCSQCLRHYAFQLAFCYRIGFGTGRDIETSRIWLDKAVATEGELHSAMERLTQEYRLTGRLTEQVRAALGIGVLVTTDRTQQYRLQGRLLTAEQSLASEINARESELGLSHFCLAKLKSDLALIYSSQGRLGGAEKLQREVIGILAEKNGETHPSVLASKAALAAVLAEAGLLMEAEKRQRDLQPLFEQILGKEHPETVIALQNWGVTLHSQNRHREAADIFRQVRATRVRTLTENHPLTLRADICLASTLGGQGLLKDADELMARVARSSASSGDPVIEGYVQMNLANLYKEQNHLQEAEDAARRAVRVLGRKLGKDDSMRLNAEEVLAVVYGEKRDFAKQEELLRAILQAKTSLNERSPSVSNTKTYLATNLLRQGRMQDSVKEAKAVLESLKDSLSLDPGNFLACTEILASTMWREGHLEEAEALRKKLLLSCEGTLGESNPFTMQARSALADFYAEQGRFDTATELQAHNLKTLEDSNQVGRFAIQTARELALTFREQSRFVEAVELCHKALLWCEKAVGSVHIDTVAVNNILAGTYLQMGLIGQADAIYKLKVLPYVTGTDLEMYAYEAMANLRRAQRRDAESMELSQKALQLTLQRLGADHPVSIKMVGNVLGGRLHREELTEELEREVSENLRLKKQILGSQHFSTIKTLSDLAYAYGGHGKFEEAGALYNSIEADTQKGGNLQNALRYATLLGKRADLSFRLEDFKPAQALEEQALAIRQRLLPAEHSAVLLSIMNLASTLSAQGMYNEAEQRLRHVISLRETHLPADAEPTLAAKKDLAAVMYFKGEFAASEALYVAVVEGSQRTAVSPVVLQRRMAELRKVREAMKEAQINQAKAGT